MNLLLRSLTAFKERHVGLRCRTGTWSACNATADGVPFFPRLVLLAWRRRAHRRQQRKRHNVKGLDNPVSAAERLICVVFFDSALFKGLHKRGTLEANLTDDDCIGVLADSEPIEVAEAPGASDEVEERRESLPPVETVLNLKTFEELAKYVLGEESRAWRYFSSWADDGVSKCSLLLIFTLVEQA